MSLKPIRYPLDLTGKSPDNLILNEIHELKPTKIRVFVPTYGGFYTKSFVLRDAATGEVLTRGDQYEFDNLFEMASMDAKQEVCGVVVITDPNVSSTVSCDYQCIGGYYGISSEAIMKQIETLKLDNRPIEWGNVFNKPVIYPPAKHLHDIGDVYGFEYLVHAIQQLRHAVLTGDDGSHQIIYEYIDAIRDRLNNDVRELRDNVTEHKNNTSNPHNVTAHQTGTYNQEELDRLFSNLSTRLNQHSSNYNNPHKVTAHQTGTYTSAEIDEEFNTLKNGIIAQLTAHMNDTNNPHRTTAAQVGAYTKQQVNSLLADVNDDLNAHLRDYNNPHKVTAAQTGAYTKAQTDSKIKTSINTLTSDILDPNNGNKVRRDRLPVSTASGNDIIWNGDGIYYKTPIQELPVGAVVMFPEAIARPEGFLKCDGSTFNSTLYDDLYRALGNKNVLPNMSNQSDVGQLAYFPVDRAPAGWIEFKTVRGNTSIQSKYPKLYSLLVQKYGNINNVPNTAGLYLRDDGNGKALGQYLDDAIRNIRGKVAVARRGAAHADMTEGSLYYERNFNVAIKSGNSDDWGSVIGFDAARTVPVADENRPKTMVMRLFVKAQDTFSGFNFWIKAFDSVKNDVAIEISALITEIQNKADKTEVARKADKTELNDASRIYWDNGKIMAKVRKSDGSYDIRQIWPAQWADTV